MSRTDIEDLVESLIDEDRGRELTIARRRDGRIWVSDITSGKSLIEALDNVARLRAGLEPFDCPEGCDGKTCHGHCGSCRLWVKDSAVGTEYFRAADAEDESN